MKIILISKIWIWIWSLALLTGLNVAAAPSEPESFSENYTIGMEAYLSGNYHDAFNAWKLSAFEGDAEAQCNLGVMYVEGIGTDKDVERAHYWFLRAAGQQHPEAQYNLGHLYIAGAGVEADEIEAMNWWRISSDNGYPLAAYYLGRAYLSGVAGTVNWQKAKQWFLVAAERGEPRAQAFLKLNAAEIESMQQTKLEQTPKSIHTPEPEPVVAQTLKQDAEVAQLELKATQSSQADQSGDAAGARKELENEKPELVEQLTAVDESQASYLVTPRRLVKAYANADDSSMVLIQLNPGTLLKTFETRSGRVKVQRAFGFPVWIESNQLSFDNTSLVALDRAVDYSNKAQSPPAGQFKAGEVVSLLREQKRWVKVLSPWSLNAWVDEADLLDGVSNANLAAKWQASVERRLQAGSSASRIANAAKLKATQLTNRAYSRDTQLNDNAWLFNQAQGSHVIHLFSLTRIDKALKLASSALFADRAKLFSTQIRGATWYFMLQGPYSNKASAQAAQQALPNQYQRHSSVRPLSLIMKNRCERRLALLPNQADQLSIYCAN